MLKLTFGQIIGIIVTFFLFVTLPWLIYSIYKGIQHGRLLVIQRLEGDSSTTGEKGKAKEVDNTRPMSGACGYCGGCAEKGGIVAAEKVNVVQEILDSGSGKSCEHAGRKSEGSEIEELDVSVKFEGYGGGYVYDEEMDEPPEERWQLATI